MDSYVACRVCLVTEKRFTTLDTDPIVGDAYLNLVGLVVYNPLQTVCYECSALLRRCSELKEKCMRTNTILMNILKRHELISYSTIKEVDRKNLQLESNLSLVVLHETDIPSEVIGEHDTTVKVEVNEAIKEETHAETNFENLYASSDDCLLKDYINEKVKAKKKSKKKKNIKNNKTDLIINDSNNKLDEKNNGELNGLTEIVRLKEVEVVNLEPLQDLEDLQDEKDWSEESVSSSEDLGLDKLFKEKNKMKYKKKRKKQNKEENVQNNDEINGKNNRKNNGPKFDFDYFTEYAEVIDLTAEMAKKEVLSRKETSNYINCRFKCNLCFRGFEVENTYDNHMKKHSSEFGENECEFCHLRFPDHKSLWKHVYSCHKRKFSCKLCPYTCFCSSQARLHVKLHEGKKYLCNICGETFSMPNSLAMHKRIKHATECVCELCGSTFATSRGLRSHNMLIHRQEQNEKCGPFCSECNIHFANDTAWKRHLVLSSKHKVSNGCEFCGETFNDSFELKKHLRVHARKQASRADIKLPSACPLCNRWLTSKSDYKEHIILAHPTSPAARKLQNGDAAQCVCEHCGKMFKKQCFLVYHQRKHTGERPYKCEDCGKEYAFPGALSAHRASHRAPSAKATHDCHLCNKGYKTRSALLKHLKAHLGIRPHKCKICDKSFPNRCDVRVHMQYVHYKVPWPKRDRNKRNKKNNDDDCDQPLC